MFSTNASFKKYLLSLHVEVAVQSDSYNSVKYWNADVNYSNNYPLQPNNRYGKEAAVAAGALVRKLMGDFVLHGITRSP